MQKGATKKKIPVLTQVEEKANSNTEQMKVRTNVLDLYKLKTNSSLDAIATKQ